MKLGLTPWNFSDLSANALSEQARVAEGLGYESFWLPENHFNPGAIPDPLMLLAAVAAATERIRLATTSYLLPLRNPLQAAEQVAVLDQLSRGRVLLGVGRGYAPKMLQAFNVVPREKRKLFEESLEVMIRAWQGESIMVSDAAAGERDQGGGHGVDLDPLPVQKPHPPIWVAAFGPKALAQAGRLGLPYLASPMESMSQLRANYDAHASAAEQAGHPVVATRPIMRTVFVSENASELDAVRERLGQNVPQDRRGEEMALDEWAVVGKGAYVREKLQEYGRELGITHVVVTRIRVGGIEESRLRESVARVPELIRG